MALSTKKSNTVLFYNIVHCSISVHLSTASYSTVKYVSVLLYHIWSYNQPCCNVVHHVDSGSPDFHYRRISFTERLTINHKKFNTALKSLGTGNSCSESFFISLHLDYRVLLILTTVRKTLYAFTRVQ